MHRTFGWSILLVAGLFVGTLPNLSLAAPPKFSDEVPGGNAKKPHLDVKDSLSKDEPADEKVKGSTHKIHEVDLEAGKTYRIDMTSLKLHTFLRLLDPDDREVAFDDNGGGNFNSRIVYKAKRTATYKIVATALKNPFRKEITGPYRIIVRDAEPRDFVLGKLKSLMTAPNASVKEQQTVIGETLDVFAKEKSLSLQDAAISQQIAYMLDRLPKAKGVEFAGKLKTMFAGSDEKRVRAYSGMFDGVVRRLELPGNEIDLKGTKLDGKTFDWKPYKGKVVLVDFWASWCGPCKDEMPKLQKLREKYGDAGFDIVGISADVKDDAAAAYMKKNGYEWTCIYEKQTPMQPMVERYGIVAFPTTILVGRDGRVLELNPDRNRLDQIVGRYVDKKAE